MLCLKPKKYLLSKAPFSFHHACLFTNQAAINIINTSFEIFGRKVPKYTFTKIYHIWLHFTMLGQAVLQSSYVLKTAFTFIKLQNFYVRLTWENLNLFAISCNTLYTKVAVIQNSFERNTLSTFIWVVPELNTGTNGKLLTGCETVKHCTE